MGGALGVPQKEDAALDSCSQAQGVRSGCEGVVSAVRAAQGLTPAVFQGCGSVCHPSLLQATRVRGRGQEGSIGPAWAPTAQRIRSPGGGRRHHQVEG